jgi:cyclin ccl1
MNADFTKSTHAKFWTFASPEILERSRQAVHDAAIKHIAHAVQSEPQGGAEEEPPVERAELEFLCAFYESKLEEVCDEENAKDASRFSRRVRLTAQMFYKRFYLKVSAMEEDPKHMLLAAIFLAGKIEGERIEVSDLVPAYADQLKPAELLALELKLLEALHFQLVVRSPFRCLRAMLEDLHETLAESAGGATSAETNAELERLDQRAIESVEASLRSDAPLLYSPQQLALVALVVASREAAPAGAGESTIARTVDVRGWINHRFASSAASSVTADSPPLLDLLAKIEGESTCKYDFSAEGTKKRLKKTAVQLKKLREVCQQQKREEEDAGRRRAQHQAMAVENERLVREVASVRAEVKRELEAGGGADDSFLRKRRRVQFEPAPAESGGSAKSEGPVKSERPS